MLITAFNAYFTPSSVGAWYQVWVPRLNQAPNGGLNQDPSDSECSALTLFSMTLTHTHVNLKEPYNQDNKELVTNKYFSKNKAGFTWISRPQRHSVQKAFFKFNLLFVNFSNDTAITQVKVNERPIIWSVIFKFVSHQDRWNFSDIGVQITGKTSCLRNLIISSSFKLSPHKFAQKILFPH